MHLPLESLIITFKRVITYLSMNVALRVGISMVRDKENLIHRIRNIEEKGDWTAIFKVVTIVTSRFSNNFFTEGERQECDMKRVVSNHLTTHPWLMPI